MKLSSGLTGVAGVFAVLLLSAPHAASAQSISPYASWSCTFPSAGTDCGFYEQMAAPSRATIVSSGAGGTSTSVDLTTEPGDSNLFGSGTAERADLELPPSSNYCNQGQEEWWAHSLMFASNYVIPPAGSVWNWGVVFDFHHTGSTGQPNFQIASLPTGLQLWVSGGASIVNGPGDPGFYSVSIGTVQKNVWYNFMYHVKWSSGSDGYFQAWLNGTEVMNFSGPTLYTGQSCYLKLANYHTPLGVPISILHSRIVEGATQADVQIPASGSGGGGSPTVVSLSSAANIDGIGKNGSAVQSGGLDGDGNAYSATLLGTSVTWNSNSYALLGADAADTVSDKSVALPAGKYSTIYLLGAAVNGNQSNQTFTVKYTDGTSSAFAQSVSDWHTPQHYSGETVVKQMAYRVATNGTLDEAGPFNLYGYSFTINSSKTVASLVLPANRKVVILGVDLH